MYPFKGAQVYPYNQWYVVAFSHEVNRDLMERWVLGQPLVFYRTEAGQAVALSNRCAHRRYPLSRGRLVGDDLQCGYHGFTYNCSGECVLIPSQEGITAKMRVKPYPLVERWQLIWAWLGDPEQADPALLPPAPAQFQYENPQWLAVVGGKFHLKARYQLLNENLLDLSHLTYLHPANIGTANVATTPSHTEIVKGMVRVSRQMENEPAPGLYQKALGIRGNINRLQITEFTPPGFHAIQVHTQPVERLDEPPLIHNVLHIVTPETPTSTHYFFAIARNYAIDQDRVTQALREGFTKVFIEDVDALEAQEQLIITDQNDTPEFYVKADAGALKARQLMQHLIEAEALPELTKI